MKLLVKYQGRALLSWIVSRQGTQLHSHDYKDSRGYEDKKIVVIGLGNSGGDIAVELGRCSRQVWKYWQIVPALFLKKMITGLFF